MEVHPTTLLKAFELNPVPYNPNKMTQGKFEALKESIRAVGFVEPIVVQADGLNIIGGHHRLKALKEIVIEDGTALPEIPCIVIDVTDIEAKKLNLKLNHLKGEPDARLLGEVLVDLFPVQVDRMDLEFEALGLAADEAMRYMNIVNPNPIVSQTGEVRTFGKSVTISLEFSDTRIRDKIKAALQERVTVQKKKSGHVVAELLSLPSKGTGKAQAAKKAGKAKASHA